MNVTSITKSKHHFMLKIAGVYGQVDHESLFYFIVMTLSLMITSSLG